MIMAITVTAKVNIFIFPNSSGEKNLVIMGTLINAIPASIHDATENFMIEVRNDLLGFVSGFISFDSKLEFI
jgi:hypothetical protein